MEWYSDALGGVCALSAMLDGHLCALKSVLPSSSSGTTGPAATSGSATSPPSARRPTLSRGNTHETIGFGRMVSSSSLSSSQTAISTSSGTTTGSASVLIGASTLNLNNPLPPIPAPEFDPLFSSLSTSTPPPSKATTSNPSTTASDSSSEAIAQLVSQYTAFPKFVNTQALNHLEKITRVFAAFVCPLIMRDVAVLIQGLRSRTTADGGEWMGAML
ncbi:hypothetical protein FRC17_006312 [Serendipita sp. 399]|nr:hypothetical protein FRC17_006312 [Serendipita sp. 399]